MKFIPQGQLKQAAVAGVLAVIATFGLMGMARLPSSALSLTGALLLPFYIIGVAASGNPHAPNEIIAYCCMFAVVWGLCFLNLRVLSTYSCGDKQDQQASPRRKY